MSTIISLCVNNISKQIEEKFAQLPEFKTNQVGGFYTNGIKTTSIEFHNNVMSELSIITRYPELFGQISRDGGKVQLYITMLEQKNNEISFTQETIAFMAQYEIGLGVD